mmetsp:Transcript_25/g.35  ORF Transcript_25/g.35 Transcript_25/m.35 type:complete len:231 (-) Transcript_25:56-748(-)
MFSPMSSFNPYTKAVILNNEGAAMIEVGNFVGSRIAFKKALHLLRSIEQPEKQPRQCESRSTVHFRWSSKTALSSKHHLNCSNSSSFIYRRALLILPSNTSESNSCHTAETATILYNLSLSLHLEGHISNTSSLLKRSIKAYRITLLFQKKVNLQNKFRGGGLLGVAINNNMAMVHQEFMEYSAAHDCFSAVSRGMRRLRITGHLEHNEYQGLILNLMMNTQHKNLAAAA